MPIQTLVCPECSTTITADIPIGTRARIEHREGVDLIKVTPNVMPIHRPEVSERSERPLRTPNDNFGVFFTGGGR